MLAKSLLYCLLVITVVFSVEWVPGNEYRQRLRNKTFFCFGLACKIPYSNNSWALITFICSFHMNRQYLEVLRDHTHRCNLDPASQKICRVVADSSWVFSCRSLPEWERSLGRLPFHGTKVVSLPSSLLNSIISTKSAMRESLIFPTIKSFCLHVRAWVQPLRHK